MDARFDKGTINGVSYTNALYLHPLQYASGPERRVEIDAGRSRKRFLGDLGIPDTEASTSAYKVDISLDGAAPIYSTELKFGETKKIDLDITNVLRIKILVSSISGYAYLAIGSPRLT
ncbi:MAG: NPCBM/NEW2 domain-containing protein [Acidimicrobiales bacterium]